MPQGKQGTLTSHTAHRRKHTTNKTEDTSARNATAVSHTTERSPEHTHRNKRRKQGRPARGESRRAGAPHTQTPGTNTAHTAHPTDPPPPETAARTLHHDRQARAQPTAVPGSHAAHEPGADPTPQLPRPVSRQAQPGAGPAHPHAVTTTRATYARAEGPSRHRRVAREGKKIVRGHGKAGENRLAHEARHERRTSPHLPRNGAAQGSGEVPHRPLQECAAAHRPRRRGDGGELAQERKSSLSSPAESSRAVRTRRRPCRCGRSRSTWPPPPA